MFRKEGGAFAGAERVPELPPGRTPVHSGRYIWGVVFDWSKNKNRTGRPYIMIVEYLLNGGPVALLQDLAAITVYPAFGLVVRDP